MKNFIQNLKKHKNNWKTNYLKFPNFEKMRHKVKKFKNKKREFIDRGKKFSNIEKEKKEIINLYKKNDMKSFYKHLLYLEQMQKGDREYLSKSLCDISKIIDNSKIQLEVLEKAYNYNSYDSVTLTSYATALANKNKFDRAFELFEKSLEINSTDHITIFLYAMALEKSGDFQEAIKLLTTLKDMEFDRNYVIFLSLTLGRLYYAVSNKTLGDKYFDYAINNSPNKNETLLESAKNILSHNPYSKDAINILKKITEESKEYKSAFKILTNNLPIDKYFEQFKDSFGEEEEFKELDELYRGIYHKLDNQTSVLENRVNRYLKESREEEDIEVFKKILERVENMQQHIDSERNLEKRELNKIDKSDFDLMMDEISKASHNITDITLNDLFKVENLIYRFEKTNSNNNNLLHKLKILKSQIDIISSTINNFKSINEGDTLSSIEFKLLEFRDSFDRKDKIYENSNITINIENENEIFYADKNRIIEFLNEFIENSTNHNPNFQIEITIDIKIVKNPNIDGVQTSKNYLFINYRDNGKGIEKDKKEWIFLPLRTTSDKGSGLGLFIIKKTIEKMGGSIKESGNNGVNFKIFIPNQKETK